MIRRLQRCQNEPSAFAGGKAVARPVRFSAARPVAIPCSGPPRMVPAAAPCNRFAHRWHTGRPVTVVVAAGDSRHSLHGSAMNYPRSTLVTSNGDELTELARREAVDVVDQVYGYRRIGESGKTQDAFGPVDQSSGIES